VVYSSVDVGEILTVAEVARLRMVDNDKVKLSFIKLPLLSIVPVTVTGRWEP